MGASDVETGKTPAGRKLAYEREFEFEDAPEPILTPIEKSFLLTAEKGDVAGVKRIIDENKDNAQEFSINCVDPLNRSALLSAIENENFELILLLLEEGIQVNDALLHAIYEEYVEGVETLLEWEEKHHEPGTAYSWEAVNRQSSTFTQDITPLILAAHKNNYEILKLLLDRGATLPMPHDIKCGCDECVASSQSDSLRHSQSRINAYRALSASSLIALSSRDPVLTAFELSAELRRLSSMETEFRAEYTEMREGVLEFATQLLDHARTSVELEIMLNYNADGENWEPGERQTLERLKLAIKYSQKRFVAHPNVQQLLAAIWYDGLPGFRRKTGIGQLIQVAQIGCMFPVYSTIYMLAPESETAKLIRKPFAKFISHSASYFMFLMCLGAASQRVEALALYLAGHFLNLPFLLEILAEWKRKERGAFPGMFECFVIIYIVALIWAEVRTLYEEGLMEYITDLWNIVDFISNTFYVAWICLRFTAWFTVWRDERRGFNPYIPREHWDQFDPMLISEGAFAAGMIFSFLKLVHIFSINPHLGPLQVSLGRMIIDIIKFFFIYTLVLFAFGCGLNQLLWYYADLEKNKCYHLPNPDLPDFDDQEKACSIWRRFANLFETSQSLFWASFGLVDLVSFDLQGIKGFTRFWALLMFGSYSVINIIVLLNMLIAMMSNSYQIISERADVEWKFARTMLWISYFEDGDTLPPPFNIFPTIKNVKRFLGIGPSLRPTNSLRRRTREKAQRRHDAVMRLLIRRYVTSEQRRHDEFGITEDDIVEVRQDISSMRYELIDILSKNGMKVTSNQRGDLAGKKGKIMERRIMKDFQIGIVDDLLSKTMAASASSGGNISDVFGAIAKAIGKKSQKNKEDWNEIQRKNTIKSDPIGARTTSIKRKDNRKSLRMQILEHNAAGETVPADQLLEYNPNLAEVSVATRQAYVKFMVPKIKKEFGDGVSDFEERAAKRASQKSLKSISVTDLIKTSSIKRSESDKFTTTESSTSAEVQEPKKNEPEAAAEPIPTTSVKTDESAVQEIKREKSNVVPKKSLKKPAPGNRAPSPIPEEPNVPVKVSVSSPPPAADKADEKLVKSPTDPPKPDASTKPKEPPPKKEEKLKPPPVERVDVQGSPLRGKSKVSGKVVSGWL